MTSFRQGYIAAIREDVGSDAEFSPAAMAMIERDCSNPPSEQSVGADKLKAAGAEFYRRRQARGLPWFPPLAHSIRGGKIELEVQT